MTPETNDKIQRGQFVCYECRDDNCKECVGIPCMCDCPVPLKEQPEPDYSI